MPESAKTLSPKTIVAPAEPNEAREADDAEPGEVSSVSGEGEKPESHKPTDEDKKKKTGWIEIEMVDEADMPVAGEAYRIILPDGKEACGTLDEKGFARVDGFEPGTCKVSFPNLDKDAWEPL